jgi:hypothetical protein
MEAKLCLLSSEKWGIYALSAFLSYLLDVNPNKKR